MGERTIRVCDGCQADEGDLARVKAEWGIWYRPRNKGGVSRLDFCGVCAGGTEDAIRKYASVMANRNGHAAEAEADEDENGDRTPLVDRIVEKRARPGQMLREGPILTKDDRARLAAYKAAANEGQDSRQPVAERSARAPGESGPVRKF